jgi:hypothetical protein
MVIEHDFKHQVWQPKDHFEKLLKVACPNHTYPVKHKHKDCTMMKKFMTSGVLSRSKKAERDLCGKGVTSVLEKAVVMTIYG